MAKTNPYAQHNSHERSASSKLAKAGSLERRDWSRYPVRVQFERLAAKVAQLELMLHQALRARQFERVHKLTTHIANQINTLDVLRNKVAELDVKQPLPVDHVETWKGHIVRPDLSVNYNEMVRKYGPTQRRWGIQYVNDGKLMTPRKEPLRFT